MKRLQRMPGASFERPRAYKLTDIEPQTSKGPSRCSGAADGESGSSMASLGSQARFPKLDECAHFHYEHVELGKLDVSMSSAEEEQQQASCSTQPAGSFAVRVTSGDACWTLQRTFENLVMFDKQLHRCIFDRKFSLLADLEAEGAERGELSTEELREYLRRFSALNHEGLNCGPVLNWLQLDNRGRRILVPEADSCPINTPAVAAAYAVRPYQAQAPDELSFSVGSMISVIDMPPAGESSWWRGKHGFAVGFFPAECVAVIGDKLPRQLAGLQQPVPQAASLSSSSAGSQPVKPVLRKHGKLIAFFRSFILNRPSRRRLKQSGILRERVFGCDLGEHLLNSGQEVPCVLRCCAEFIERHGLVDGIYRLSGVSSNIQRLRHAFDEDRRPALHSDEVILQDIHSVASLLKMYFRELPNPLCTYQLYSTFVAAVQAPNDQERLAKMRDAVRKLPPPHYRTLEYLMRHLVRVAARGEETGMTPRNVAIVWAPNLLRCKELEVGGVAALQGVGVQAVVTEFLICYAELIFATSPSDALTTQSQQRPKSLAIAANSARLLSLEEARSRSFVQEPELIEVGAGSAGLPPHYHTVIELPQRKRQSSKRSPSLNWRALFGGKASNATVTGQASTSQVTAAIKPITKMPEPAGSKRPEPPRLRPVKSADSLDGDGLGPLLGPVQPRPAGHSRSVSHDSYFEQLGSALDLSEIQLSFELEEREMRMLDDELEASPRRQPELVTVASSSVSASPSNSSVITKSETGGGGGGGSKRKRSRLEERLHCDVELRFIDSQSPDQVMLAADVHEMESPSPLPTPGYLPLLSEGSTPLTPTTSPRISFKSFCLPLEIGDTSEKSNLLQSCLTKASGEQDTTCCLDLDSNGGRVMHKSPEPLPPQIVDQEMPCERLFDSLKASEINKVTRHSDDSTSQQEVLHQDHKSCNSLDDVFTKSETMCEVTTERESNTESNSNDLDCIMPYEQTTDLSFNPETSNNTIIDTSSYNNDIQNVEKWLIPDLSAGSVIASSDLQQTTDSKISQILPELEKCQCSSSACNDYENSICFSESNKGVVSNFDSTCEKCRSKTLQPTDPNNIQNELPSSIPLETSIHPSASELETDPNQLNSNIRNHSECQNNEIENHVSGWNLLLEDENLLKSDKNNLIDDRNHGNQFVDHIKDENEQKIALFIEQQNESSEKTACDVSKETQIDNNKPVTDTSKCSNICANSEADSTNISQESSNTNTQDTAIHDLDVVIPSDNAAVEPQEMAHVPELLSENVIVNSSVSFTPASNSNIERNSILHKDTATILQELALQRLSGGDRADSIPIRKRYDDDIMRDRRSFDSEIGREIVREHKMKQELENARGKLDETSSHNQTVLATHLPPCLRARHARSTRATLSRSLDEAKFNKMTSSCGRGVEQQKTESSQQHGSTPNVGSKSSEQSGISERSIQSLNKNLGLDLDDPRCRERIEKYKEERRTFLRDKYRSESFRAQVTPSANEEDGEQALLARLKQRASRPSLL